MKNKNLNLNNKKLPPVVYGLDGIRRLFDISTSSAVKYSKDVIKDACAQQGKVIIVDTLYALTLFGIDNAESLVSTKKLPPLVYGLEGIRSLFDVSTTTAWRYRNGLIKDACTQKNKVIVVNTVKALTLFGVKNAESLVAQK